MVQQTCPYGKRALRWTRDSRKAWEPPLPGAGDHVLMFQMSHSKIPSKKGIYRRVMVN